MPPPLPPPQPWSGTNKWVLARTHIRTFDGYCGMNRPNTRCDTAKVVGFLIWTETHATMIKKTGTFSFCQPITHSLRGKQ